MKRMLLLCLCGLLLLTLVSCGDDELYEAPATNPAYTEPGTIPEPSGSITIELPLAFLTSEQKENLPAYADSHGFYGAQIDEDKGIVTLVMNDLTHRLLLTTIGLDVIDALYGYLEDEAFPYFKAIETYDSTDFSELVILVDGNAYVYSGDEDLLPYTLAQTCMIYQGYTESTKYHCRVIVKDQETGGLVLDETYSLSNKDINK